MKKLILAGVAAAMLMPAPLAFAQDGTDAANEGLYLSREDNGMFRVYGPDNMEGSELLMGESGAQPANCPDGAYFINENEFNDETEIVRGCNTEDEYAVNAAAGDQMMSSGEPYPENSYLLTRREN